MTAPSEFSLRLGANNLLVWPGLRITLKPLVRNGTWVNRESARVGKGIWRIRDIRLPDADPRPIYPWITLDWAPAATATARRSPITRTAAWFDEFTLAYTRGERLSVARSPTELVGWRDGGIQADPAPTPAPTPDLGLTARGYQILGQIPSRTDPKKKYVVALNPSTQELSCDCPGWINRRECRHVIVFRAMLDINTPPAQVAATASTLAGRAYTNADRPPSAAFQSAAQKIVEQATRTPEPAAPRPAPNPSRKISFLD